MKHLYVVMRDYDESSTPVKVFDSEVAATSFGRNLATREDDCNVAYSLWRQEPGKFTRLKYYTSLPAYRRLEPFDWGTLDD